MEKRTNYEQEKMTITKQVSEIMENVVEKSFSELDSTSVEFMKKLYTGRKNRAMKGGRLRDIIVKLTLNLCGVNKLNSDHLKVIASGELYNMSSYYQNWHLDDKKEIKTELDKKLCHIASHLFRELAEKLILDTNFSDFIKLSLLKEISESNKAIQMGQSFELNFLNSNNIDKITDNNIGEYYTKRSYLFSGRFYGCSFAMGGIMAEENIEKINFLRQIGEWFGTGGQIINDVGDFCLNKDIAKNPEKDYQDQFADLEKGTITLAIYELAKFIDIRKYIGRKLTNKEKENLLKIMVKNRCFDSSRKKTNELKNKIIKSISLLNKNSATIDLKFIVKTFFNCNKFYVNLREENGYIWGKQNE
jgi:geranylgeranyl pyrophosphate synthase